MARLHKRWSPVLKIGQGSLYRWFLCGTLDNDEYAYYVGCIESFGSPDGPFNLETWNFEDEDWDAIGTFPTLKQAKIMGRLMAGVALNKGGQHVQDN